MLPVPLGVGVGLPVPVPEPLTDGVAAAVPDAVTVPLPVTVALPVPLGEAPCDRLDVGVAVGEAVCEGVPEPDTVTVALEL